MNNNDIKIKTRKKLIEVALPLDAINAACTREKSIRQGHPSTLHLWWARRPLAAARAVIFSQMVDDPSEHPEEFPTEEAQEKERQRLFRLIEQLVLWENTTNENVLQQARDEIWKSWRSTCADNKDHPRAIELFDPEKLPAFHDPFCGGGALPLEAQRLGLESYASDLNPVAVLITKAMIEIPPKFAGLPPVNPDSRKDNTLFKEDWAGAKGLAEDVRYYGKWMRNEAEKRIGHLYPKVEVTSEMAKERPDLKQYVGQKLTVIAWLWARTVKSPNPAFTNVDVPLVSTFMLSTKKGKEAYVEPVIENGGYRFTVKVGKPSDDPAAKAGTKLSGNSFRCLMSNVPMPYAYIDDEANAGRMHTRLMAVVAKGQRGRVYLGPTDEMEAISHLAESAWKPDTPSRGTWASNAQGRRYGFRTFGDYFTPRQLVALTTISDLVMEARDQVKRDAVAAGMADDGVGVNSGGTSATAYGDTLGVYLAFAMSKVANIGSTIATWMNDRGAFRETFARQGIPMTWEYAEANQFGDAGGSLGIAIQKSVMVLKALPESTIAGVTQSNAATQTITSGKIVSTDPPYYDNVGFADLSDFFYVWLRRSLQTTFPDLFATLSVPKAEELVADRYRHGSREKANTFFLDGMMQAIHQLAARAHHAFPVTIYYAFKQLETKGKGDMINTGWATFLDALIRSGFSISGAWPLRTESTGRINAQGANSLASSIVLVCRPLDVDAPLATRHDFIATLSAELPQAIRLLEATNIAPVDLAQAVIGPGMEMFTRYAKVLDASGEAVSVRDALSLINQTLDEVLTEQEGDLDADSRWALTWFEQQGFFEGDYGVAETLSKSRNTSIDGMAQAGILLSGRGKVRLLRPDELPEDWDPTTDTRTPAWESVHHLVRALEAGGESVAAELMSKLGAGKSEIARELAYQLYIICERKNWAREALPYNALVQSWPEISRLARQVSLEQQSSFL